MHSRTGAKTRDAVRHQAARAKAGFDLKATGVPRRGFHGRMANRQRIRTGDDAAIRTGTATQRGRCVDAVCAIGSRHWCFQVVSQ
jgi:hypothetical protein